MGESVAIDMDLLRKLFDCAVGSMNFTSGMFDDEEVEALRSVATIIGVDPMVGTPDNYQCKYGRPHQRYTAWSGAIGKTTDVCMLCHKPIMPGDKVQP